MSAGRAYIAVPLPRTARWRLLTDPRQLPADFVIIGQLTVGRDDAPALAVQTPAGSLAPPLAVERPLCAHCPLRAQLLEADPERPP
jgi:hypothetical protein